MATIEEEKANEGKVRGIAKAVAKVLGGKWAMEKRERDYVHYCEIEDGATGARLGFSTHDGKVHISGQFVLKVEDRTVFYRTAASPNASIGVGVTRPAETIAREIQRRLFPAYLPEWQKNLAAIAEFHNHNTKTMQVAERLTARIGAKAPRMDGRRAILRPYNSRKLNTRFVFDLSVNEDSVRFDSLDVGEETAAKILDLLIEAARTRSDG